jgi:hypothetical protein
MGKGGAVIAVMGLQQLLQSIDFPYFNSRDELQQQQQLCLDMAVSS